MAQRLARLEAVYAAAQVLLRNSEECGGTVTDLDRLQAAVDQVTSDA